MNDRTARMRGLIEFLCSPACGGRRPGTPGGVAARERLVDELRATGLEPLGGDGPGRAAWLQTVPDCGANVIGRVPGSGALADRAIVVGAHYDHLGAAHGGQCYWGADDNAAAVAMVVEAARALVAQRPGGDRRQVIVCLFDGEEPPHFLSSTMGSMHFVRRPPVPLERLDGMVCLDLVGHALGPPGTPEVVRNALFVLGAERSPGTGALVDRVAARARGVAPRRAGIDVIPPLSDYHAFQEAGVASVFLTCGRWQHYHQVTDTPEKLDLPKIEATGAFLVDLLDALATRTDGPVRYRKDDRDDLATLATLGELGRALQALSPLVGMAVVQVEMLRRKAAKGPLPKGDQDAIRLMVARLESALA